MTSRVRARPIGAVPLSLLLLSGCAQGTFGVSPSTILSAVIMAGDAMGSHSTSSDTRTTTTESRTTSPSSRARNLPRSPTPTAMANRVLGTADQYVGVPYTWGGNSPERGFDCSGFTRFVFGKQGIQLPRTSREQARAGLGVALDFGALLPGDIMLFAEPGEAISHVAIYVGSGEIIHSSSAGRGVRYDDLNTSRGDWFVQNMVAARRLTANGRSLVQPLGYLTIPGTPLDPPDKATLQR